MTTRTRLCAAVVVALFMITSAQDSSAQLRSLASTQVVATPAMSAAAPGGPGVMFGPIVGYDLSPDAFNFGAFVFLSDLIESMPELKFMADAAYGIGTEQWANNFDYNTFRIAVTALYLVALSNSNINLLPLAGLVYYRLNISYEGFGGFNAGGSDVALALGVALIYNQFFFRVMTSLGGASDLGIAVGMLFGNKK